MRDNGQATEPTLQLEPVQFADRRGSLLSPLGDAGLARYGGIIADEIPPHLQGRRWLRTVRHMLLSPTIRGMLFAVELLIRRAEWTMEPAEDGGTEAQEVAEFVESARLDMRQPWEDTLAEILSFLAYGFSLHEIVLKRRLGPEGPVPSASDDGLIGWAEWSPRAQDTVTRWVFDDAGHVIAFEQQAPMLPRPVVIPLSRCLHFRAGGYRGSPEGESVLRAAWTDWDAITKLQLIEAIGIERDLAGLPVALLPPQYLAKTRTPEQAAVFEAVKRIVTGVRNNDQAGVIFPLEYDQAGKPAFEFKLLSAGGERQFDTGAVIGRRTTQMTMAMLADFLTLGHQGVGSYALSQDKTRLFTTAISAWLDVIANVINDQAIRSLIGINGIDPRLTPALRPGALDDTDLAATGQFVTALLPLITALDRKDQITLAGHLFDVADWPAVTTDPEKEAEPPEQPPRAPVTPPPGEDGEPGQQDQDTPEGAAVADQEGANG